MIVVLLAIIRFLVSVSQAGAQFSWNWLIHAYNKNKIVIVVFSSQCARTKDKYAKFNYISH